MSKQKYSRGKDNQETGVFTATATNSKRNILEIVVHWSTIGVFLLGGVGIWITYSGIQDSNERSDKSLYLSLRPYLSVQSILPTKLNLQQDDTVRVTIVFKNTGQTPAYWLTVGQGDVLRAGTDIYTDNIDDVLRQTHGTFGASFIGAGMEYYHELPVGLVASHEHKKHNSEPALFLLYGKIAFRDVFDSLHVMTYAYRYFMDEGRWIPHKFNREYRTEELYQYQEKILF